MKPPVTFLAIGSRGDVEPLAILAGALVAGGRAATVIAIDDYADLVRGHGAAFRGIGAAMHEVQRIGSSWLGHAALRTPLAQPLLLRQWLSGLAEPLADALDEVAPGSLVVTGVASRDAGLALVEQRGCRMATVLHTAVLPTAQRDSHLEGRWFWGVPGADRAFTRWYWRSVSGVSRATSSTFRARHGLGRPGDGTVTAAADRHPVWLAADPVLVPLASDWPDGVVQTGAIRPVTAEPLQPGEPLASFLPAGPPPVYLGVGSLTDAGGQRWLERIVAAARRSGRRVLTPALTGSEPMLVDDLVCTIAPVPHDALFPLVAGLIHHGGAGTTAAALRAGVASVAVPAAFDQYYHARRLQALGVGPPPVPLHALSVGRLANLISEVGSGRYAQRAAVVGRQARSVDGTALTLAQLSRLA